MAGPDSGRGHGFWTRRNLLRAGGAAAVLGATGTAATHGSRAIAADGRPTASEPAPARPKQGWNSELVYPDADGRLVYETDDAGNRIPDFSWAGYRNGEVELPEVDVAASIGPISGDNTAHIQQALDAVGEREPDADGFRGALLLEPGEYDVASTIYLNRSGVVLRGSGRESDPENNTILIGTGSGDVETVIQAGGTVDWADEVPDTRTDIVSDLVGVGSRTFTVADASKLSVGDNVIIFHPHTQEWIDAIDGGGVRDGEPWPVGERPIIFNRYIKQIDGNDLEICAPVYNHLDRSLSQSYVYVWSRSGLINNVGVEGLRIHMNYPPDTDENHPQNCVLFDGVEDGWVQDSVFLHFSFAGVVCRRTTRTTVLHVRASHPRSVLEGGKRYNFNVGPYTQQVLFRDLWATHARHAFASSGSTRASGCVWLDGFNEEGYSESGGHHRWSQGLLFDNIQELSSNSPNAWVLNLHNRGHISNHGWSSVHSVLWNCTVNNGDRACVQRPPTAQNYSIGTIGEASEVNWFTDVPAGHIEGTNQSGLEPGSLYDAQLADRLSA